MELKLKKERVCKICSVPINGRSDKKFCSIDCKNTYNVSLRKVTITVSKETDRILHRNRSILLEIMGKNAVQKKVSRTQLDKKKFNYNYITRYHINSNNKHVHFVYDFSWITFSDGEVLIRRIGKKE